MRTSAAAVAAQFELFELPASLADLKPRYNVSPTQNVAAVRMAADGRRTLDLLRWGLIPSWADDPAIGARMINARAETVAEKPSFRTALSRRRCLLPADGFYEWRKIGRQKQPCLFSLADGGLFAFAGLWETWRRGEQTIESCTLITTEANDVVRPCHDRMPVILAPADYGLWLDPALTQSPPLLSLLRPFPADAMTMREADVWVNSPTHEGPRCLGEP